MIDWENISQGYGAVLCKDNILGSLNYCLKQHYGEVDAVIEQWNNIPKCIWALLLNWITFSVALGCCSSSWNNILNKSVQGMVDWNNISQRSDDVIGLDNSLHTMTSA